MGIFDDASTKVALASADPTPIADVQIIENVKRLQTLGRLPLAAPAETVDRAKMDELQEKLEDALALQIGDRIISVKRNKEGIVVSLREAGFFQSGSTQLGPQTVPALAAIVKIIGPEKTNIRIEGHTDNVPIHNGKYDSNWELSTARAHRGAATPAPARKARKTRRASAPDRPRPCPESARDLRRGCGRKEPGWATPAVSRARIAAPACLRRARDSDPESPGRNRVPQPTSWPLRLHGSSPPCSAHDLSFPAEMSRGRDHFQPLANA